MKKLFLAATVVLLLLGFVFWRCNASLRNTKKRVRGINLPIASLVASKKFFRYSFDSPGMLEETGSMDESSSKFWWVNSGAMLIFEEGHGSTVQGELPENSSWRLLYADHNAESTDNGYHPQNIFRLVTQSKWRSFRQEAYFRIVRDNLSASTHRNESNGLLLFNRYQDSDNLYYAGIRVDGAAVIKKKINANYFTMAYKQVFSGEPYDRTANPNLLPKNTWIGVRSEVRNIRGGTVRIRIFMDDNRTRRWRLVLEAKDDGTSFGGPPFLGQGYAGIRADFMDVEFDDYLITRF